MRPSRKLPKNVNAIPVAGRRVRIWMSASIWTTRTPQEWMGYPDGDRMTVRPAVIAHPTPLACLADRRGRRSRSSRFRNPTPPPSKNLPPMCPLRLVRSSRPRRFTGSSILVTSPVRDPVWVSVDSHLPPFSSTFPPHLPSTSRTSIQVPRHHTPRRGKGTDRPRR